LLAIIKHRTDNQNIQGAQKTKPPQKNNDSVKKWATDRNRTFSKEEIQMAKKQVKKCSTPLTIKEMEIKITLRFHLTPVRITVIKNAREKGIAGEKVSYYNHFGKQY
jgi:hypothetical protein